MSRARREALRLIQEAFDREGIRMAVPTYAILPDKDAPEPRKETPSPRIAKAVLAATHDTAPLRTLEEAVERDRQSAETRDLLQASALKE